MFVIQITLYIVYAHKLLTCCLVVRAVHCTCRAEMSDDSYGLGSKSLDVRERRPFVCRQKHSCQSLISLSTSTTVCALSRDFRSTTVVVGAAMARTTAVCDSAAEKLRPGNSKRFSRGFSTAAGGGGGGIVSCSVCFFTSGRADVCSRYITGRCIIYNTR